MVRLVWAGSGLCSRSARNFFPLCLTRLLRKLADLCACFKVLSAGFRYRPSEVVASLDLAAEIELHLGLRARSRMEIG